MKINDVAVTEKSYLELNRSTTGTEQMQVMEWLTVAHIDSTKPLPSENGLMVVEIPKDQLFRWGLCAPQNLQRDLDRLAKNMGQLQFFMEKGKRWIWATAFPRIEYVQGEDCIRVAVIGNLAPKLTELKENFRQFELPILFNELHGFYARKLYLQFRNALHHNSYSTQMELTFGELKSRLGLKKGRYPDWPSFNRDILKPAFKEMHKADLDLSIQLKTKRARPGRPDEKPLVFLITHRDRKHQPLEIPPELSKLTDWSNGYLQSIGFNRPQMFEALARDHGTKAVDQALRDFAKAMSNVDTARVNVAGILNNRFYLYLDKALAAEKRREDMEKVVKDKETAKAAADAAEQAEEAKDREKFAKWKKDNPEEFQRRMDEKQTGPMAGLPESLYEGWVFGEWKSETAYLCRTEKGRERILESIDSLER